MNMEVLLPFIVVHPDEENEIELGLEELLSIWMTYLNKGFPKDVIKVGRNNICKEKRIAKFKK